MKLIYILLKSITYSLIIVSCANSNKNNKNFSVSKNLPMEIKNYTPLSHNIIIKEDIYFDSLNIFYGTKYSLSYFDGKLNCLAELNEKGIENGTYIEFHTNGEIYNIGNMKNGKLNGSCKTYSSGGNLIEYSYLINGVIIEKLIHSKRDSILSFDNRNNHLPNYNE